MSTYWRKIKDFSGEKLGDERLEQRLRRIKDKDYERYVELYFDGTYLTSLPTVIYKFEKLECLWLTGNKLTTLPEEITWLVNLKNLRLDRNRFETLPHCIGRLPSLTHLGVNKNRLKTLPVELADLAKLESLYLDENPDLRSDWAQDFKEKEETQAFLAVLKIELKPAAQQVATLTNASAAASGGVEEAPVAQDEDDEAPLIETVPESAE